MLDCCFSGRAASAMGGTESAVTAAGEISGTYTITSAPQNAVAIAEPGARFTAFTGELLRLLREGILGGGDLLSLREIPPEPVRGLQLRGMPKPQHLGTSLAVGAAKRLLASTKHRHALFTDDERYTACTRLAEYGYPP